MSRTTTSLDEAADTRVIEAVILARAFSNDRGRSIIAASFPASVVDLYDATVSRTEWSPAATLAERALVLLGVLDLR